MAKSTKSIKMRNKLYLILIVLLTISSCSSQSSKQPADWVDVQIGSVHGRWFFYTPAARPFGMVKLAPTTNAYGSIGSWLPCGYDNRHTSIEGFAHLHEFQIGGIVTIPTVGELKTLPGTDSLPDTGYRSRINKATELSRPGYYMVDMTDYNIKAELTSTMRTGLHRYTFPESSQSRILFDIGHPQGESARVVDCHVEYIADSKEVVGWVETYPVYATFCQPGATVKAYFAAQIDKIPQSVGTFIDSLVVEGATSANGAGAGMFLNFATKDCEVIQMQVGVSFTSIDNARNNRQVEMSGKDFDTVVADSRNEWNEALGRIEVEGGTDSDKTKFYTALYHALLGRGTANDVNGEYITYQKTIGQIPLGDNGKPLYSIHNTDGLWGGFWNLTQLWAMAYPEVLSSYINSNLDFYKSSGWLHDGQAAGVYVNGVQTNFQSVVINAAYQAGIRDFDIDLAWEAVRKNELEYKGRDMGNGKYDNQYFITGDYIPLKEYLYPNGWVCDFGPSHTLEYSFSCYATAQLAKSLGKEQDYKELMSHALKYRNIFNYDTKFIHPREADGSFMTDYNPMAGWRGFQEGNGAQYSWYAPHDIKGLIDITGIKLFNERLEHTFVESRKIGFGGGKQIDSFSGVEKLYNQGNQPCLHISWLFNYSGKPWLTQLYTRLICREFYGTTPEHGYGYGQDEDQGQLGAWYVLGAMGLFDVQGGANTEPTIQIGSPTFDKITIKLNPKYYKGKEFVIETKNNGFENYYVNCATLNGEPLDNCWFTQRELLDGGKLELTMSSVPNKSWGVGTPPPSMTK